MAKITNPTVKIYEISGVVVAKRKTQDKYTHDARFISLRSIKKSRQKTQLK
jgi:hypothetical protein